MVTGRDTAPHDIRAWGQWEMSGIMCIEADASPAIVSARNVYHRGVEAKQQRMNAIIAIAPIACRAWGTTTLNSSCASLAQGDERWSVVHVHGGSKPGGTTFFVMAHIDVCL